jgi:hypothetical protein
MASFKANSPGNCCTCGSPPACTLCIYVTGCFGLSLPGATVSINGTGGYHDSGVTDSAGRVCFTVTVTGVITYGVSAACYTGVVGSLTLVCPGTNNKTVALGSSPLPGCECVCGCPNPQSGLSLTIHFVGGGSQALNYDSGQGLLWYCFDPGWGGFITSTWYHTTCLTDPCCECTYAPPPPFYVYIDDCCDDVGHVGIDGLAFDPDATTYLFFVIGAPPACFGFGFYMFPFIDTPPSGKCCQCDVGPDIPADHICGRCGFDWCGGGEDSRAGLCFPGTPVEYNCFGGCEQIAGNVTCPGSLPAGTAAAIGGGPMPAGYCQTNFCSVMWTCVSDAPFGVLSCGGTIIGYIY